MPGQLTANFEKPIKQHHRPSWQSFYSLKPLRGQLLQHWGVGQAQVLWDLRRNLKLVDLFATFWNVSREELLVSFDGASFAFPHEITKQGEFEDGKEMFHIDQRPGEQEFQCVQSWVTAYDVNLGDATLSVLQGSHSLLGEFAEKNWKDTGQQFLYSAESRRVSLVY